MLKEHNYVFQRVNMALDLGLTAGSVWLAHVLRNCVLGPYFMPDIFRQPSHFADYAWLIWALPVIMVLFLAHNGYYASQRIREFRQTSWSILLSAIETAAAAMVISFVLAVGRGSSVNENGMSAGSVSRGVILLIPIVLTGLLIVKSYAVRSFLVYLRQRGRNWRSLLLVGSGEPLRSFIRFVRSHPFWGFRLAGVIDDGGREGPAVEDVPVVGTLKDFFDYVEKNPVDEVVFIPARRSLERLAPYFEGCEEMGLRTRLCLNFFQHTIARPVLDAFHDIPVITYSPTKELNAALLFKYVFDRVASLILIAILSPLFLILILLIKATSRSWSDPVFYGQERSGLNGKPFMLWKFRSMKVDADKELEKLRALNEMQGPVFKIKRDPRITAIGRFLRKTSIDELPQLWNVLRGDMSLVGPRPPIPKEVEQYDRWQRRRLSMRPGITCLWQVNGRNQLPFETWMKLDLEYIDNWSLMLDFKILVKTVYVVATGYGAM